MTREEQARNILVEQVKIMGQEMIDRARDIVGNGDVLRSLNITIDFPIPFEEPPVLKVSKEYYSTRYIALMLRRPKKKVLSPEDQYQNALREYKKEKGERP